MKAWLKGCLLAVVVLALGAALTLTTPGESSKAYAGLNGQQLEAITNTAWSVEVKGYNQDGLWRDLCFPLPRVDNKLNGYWWKGRVVLIFFATSDCTGGDITARSVVVPDVQFFSDYTVVDIRPQ